MNISAYPNCFGCGVCSSVCPKGIISLQRNSDGFYQPQIEDGGMCIECGICLKVCAYNKTQTCGINQDTIGYASWSKDAAVRRKSSSGGTGFEIARNLINKGYKFIGVRYNIEKGRAEHYIACTEKELIASTGSKYIPSFTEDAFKSIRKGEKYVIAGTPCQIASLRNLIKIRNMEEDVVLIDFFCHGVPSLNMWDKYTMEAEKKVGKLTFVSWRNKRTGWHDSWAMAIDGEEHGEPVNWHDSYNMLIKKKKCYLNSRFSQGDMFYKFFLGNMCFNKSCYKDCRFKMLNSSADIRIGDLWGNKYASNELGITGVIAFTDVGKQVLSQSNVELIPEMIDVVTDGQMRENSKIPYYYSFLMRLFRTHLRLNTIYRIVQMLRIGTIVRYKFNMIK